MTSTWLVTGAAGFIGSNLCAHLLAEGEAVVGLDNFATGARTNIDRVAALGGDRFRFFEGSILDRDLVDRALVGVATVVHLAAQVSVQQSFNDVAHTNAVNVGGFLDMHAAASSAGVRRFIYASSCAVYGDNPDLPLSENALPRPLSPYAVSKLVGEHYASALRLRAPEMDAVGLRFFNIYGPWQDHRGGYAAVIPRWIDAFIRGERPVLFGDGGATRDFCFVGDLAAVIARIGRDGVGGERRVLNVGTGMGTSLIELYRTIESVLKARGIAAPRGGPEHRPWRAGDIVHSRGDVSALREAIGSIPATDLAAGIDRLLDAQYRLPRNPSA
jgi:UDP-N-acetylglucosamine/UDP-N-acetylgalactosamine 4-epimerase